MNECGCVDRESGRSSDDKLITCQLTSDAVIVVAYYPFLPLAWPTILVVIAHASRFRRD